MPDSVPYQAYRSKKHSHTHTPSNSKSHLVPNVSLPPARPSGTPSPQLRNISLDKEKEPLLTTTPPSAINIHSEYTGRSIYLPHEREDSLNVTVVQESTPINRPIIQGDSTPRQPSPSMPPSVLGLSALPPRTDNMNLKQPGRKSSTFRRVPLRGTHSLPPSSPLISSCLTPRHSHSASIPSINDVDTSKLPSQDVNNNPSSSTYPQRSTGPNTRISSTSESDASGRQLISGLSLDSSASENGQPNRITHSIGLMPPAAASSPLSAHNMSNESTSDSSILQTHSTNQSQRISAPYHPGFQPKGIFRSLTDDFLAFRRMKQEGEETGIRSSIRRVERTKLERRLEKLIALHFPTPSAEARGGPLMNGVRRGRLGVGVQERDEGENDRRASSLFDFDIRNITNLDTGGLWRGVLGAGEVNEIRAAEQRITPWQDDSAVSKCPICTTTFHPLTTRKHHCRLCGQIICSLPPKWPYRPSPCSLLFVVDSKTRRIEEVGEGVDYGVKRRKPRTMEGHINSEEHGEEEKFLKGVRICRTCRPVLLRQQYLQEIIHVPRIIELYKLFINLEYQIEESLPQFQELMLLLSHNEQSTKEASAARKRLLAAFSQYDKLAKEIRKLPCPNGPGSSQDRVQIAVMTRASLFLQKNMLPLQSLPTAKQSAVVLASHVNDNQGSDFIDPNSKVALAVQPLLEQEALLESFVEEAKARRKFEDVKTLKTNLQEIRAEINRIVVNVEGGMYIEGGNAG